MIPSSIFFVSRINYNAVTKDLDILLMPLPKHNVHHGWMYRTMVIFGDSGRLNLAENVCLVRYIGKSEYTCVLFNVLARLMQERFVLQELNREAIRNPISL